jgi:hypothetical protein
MATCAGTNTTYLNLLASITLITNTRRHTHAHRVRSDGWRQKVTENPNINADCRHQALAAGADGIPLHKDKQASSGMPFVVTAENTPVGAYRKNQHQHMFALAPSEERRYDVHGNAYTFKRDPPSIQCILMVFANELLHGQDDGYPMRDFSVPVTSPRHLFNLKVILLFFMGDYPGQGKVANMIHNGKRACHWCYHIFEAHSPGHNVALDTRRHLPPHHPMRTDDVFGPHELRDPPRSRTHAETCAYAEEAHNLGVQGDAKGKKQAQKQTGVYGPCPLAFLAFFNLIWDITGDMMHIIKGMWARKLMPMLKGEFNQSQPLEPPKTHKVAGEVVAYTPAEQRVRKRNYDKASLEWTKVHTVHAYSQTRLLSLLKHAYSAMNYHGFKLISIELPALNEYPSHHRT